MFPIPLLLLGAWFAITPYLAMWNMRAAAVDRDAQTFSSYIDFPVFKENLKSELNAKMLFEMSKDQKMKDNPFSGLAFAAGPTIVNNMVDAYISPAAIERLFKSDARQTGAEQNVATRTFNQDFMSEEQGEIAAGYKTFNEFQVAYKLRSGGGTIFVFERRNLFSWQLVNMKFE